MSDKRVSDMSDDEIRALAGAADPVAAYLTEVKRDLADIATYPRRVMDRHGPALVAAVEAALRLHAEFRIYDECGHEHTQDEVDAGTAVDAMEFVTCEDGYVHSVCRACCTGGWSQTEECASDHERPCWPCGTVEVISAALLGKGDDDAT